MSNAAFKGHPIHSLLQQILAFQTDEEILKIPTPLTDDQRWQLDRVFEIARVIEGQLTQSPSTLVSISHLDNLQSTMGQIQTELATFRSNKNPAHITNASNLIDTQAIPQMAAPFAIKPETIAAGKIGELIDDLRKRNIDAITALVKEKEVLQAQITSLTTSVSEQAARVNELTLAVEQQKKEAVAVAAEVRVEYATTERTLRDEYEKLITEMKLSYTGFRDQTKIAADAHLAVLNDKEGEAKKIVQVVGNIGVTGNYKNIADTEGSTANILRLATIGFFVVGVAIVVSSLTAQITHSLSYTELIVRLLSAIAIAAPALYTAKESARHRTNSDRARQRETELASLGPFIELMPGDKKEAIRDRLIDRYFGKDVEPHEVKHPLDLKDTNVIVKTVMDGAAKIVKSS